MRQWGFEVAGERSECAVRRRVVRVVEGRRAKIWWITMWGVSAYTSGSLQGASSPPPQPPPPPFPIPTPGVGGSDGAAVEGMRVRLNGELELAATVEKAEKCGASVKCPPLPSSGRLSSVNLFGIVIRFLLILSELPRR